MEFALRKVAGSVVVYAHIAGFIRFLGKKLTPGKYLKFREFHNLYWKILKFKIKQFKIFFLLALGSTKPQTSSEKNGAIIIGEKWLRCPGKSVYPGKVFFT